MLIHTLYSSDSTILVGKYNHVHEKVYAMETQEVRPAMGRGGHDPLVDGR